MSATQKGHFERADGYVIAGDWLAVETGKHNCGVGPDGHYGAHEPGCGLEPVERIETLLDAQAAVEKVRALVGSPPLYSHSGIPVVRLDDLRRALGGFA